MITSVLIPYFAAAVEGRTDPTLAVHTAGLIALSGCRLGKIPMALAQKQPDVALAAARRYRALFGPDHYRQLLHQEPRLIVTGIVQRQEGVVNLLARQVTALPRLNKTPGEPQR